jgi:hypothetical protein
MDSKLVINMKNNKLKSITILAIFLIIVNIASAVPPLPLELFGNSTSFNVPTSTGTTITAFYNNLSCGTFKITRRGYYGVLTCGGRDTSGSGPGPIDGSNLSFKIGTDWATGIISGTNTTTVPWSSGEFKQVDLVSPLLICGDAFCDNKENCNSCGIDCGTCPPNNGSNTNSSTGGGGGSGGGSGSGGGTGSGGTATGSGGQTAGATEDARIRGEKPQSKECNEVWECTDWTPCTNERKQTRECKDTNSCSSTKNKPELEKQCIYEGKPEEKLKNESAVPKTTPPQLQRPTIVSTCTERLPLGSVPSLLFIILIIIIILSAFFRMKYKISQSNGDKRIDDLKKVEYKYHEEEKTYTFIVIILVLAIIVYLYHYFFMLCPDKYINHLWLLGLFVLLAPGLIHLIINFLKYDEKNKILRARMLHDTHYQHIKSLIEIANQQLIRSEATITNTIFLLQKNEEFKEYLMQKKAMAQVYKDMLRLFDTYKLGGDAISIEKDLLDNLEKLNTDSDFKEASEKHPDIGGLRSGLSLLYKAYQAKQELYNELSKSEEEYAPKRADSSKEDGKKS